MKSQVQPSNEGKESIVIPFPGQPADVSIDCPPDTAPDIQRTTNGQNHTYTFKQAAEILGRNESTLRRRYWQEKVEPAFKYCPTPLRTITRYTRDEQPIYEFTKFGLEVLKTFLTAKSEGKEDEFLRQSREQFPAPPTSQKQEDVPLSPTEVLPREDEPFGKDDRPTGMVLHIGSSLTLPPIPGVITPGNDTAYLTQTQQRLQQFEAMQQQVLAQIQQQQQEAEAFNAQYQEATNLNDQLLLQEFQLKGVQLGYTALQLKQQAFKATVQAAEAGTLPAPGKPQAQSGARSDS